MALQEIQSATVPVERREYTGRYAVIVDDPDTGQVFLHGNARKASEAPRKMTIWGKRRIRVGTDAEVAAAKVEADAKFAPIKAQREADRQAARDAARQK